MSVNETFENIEQKLIHYPRFRKAPDFKTVKKVLERIGYIDDIPFIHIAGTNGKGTVLAMLSSIVQQKQLRVGMFSSPHLVDIRERMTINGELMTQEKFVEIYKNLTKVVAIIESEGEQKPTFFEWLFLMAMMYFKDEQPDLLILETGLGGKFDTTNILENKILTIITRIGLDHTAILGDTYEAIALEKAGISRKGVPMVLYNDLESVFDTVSELCGKKDIRLHKVLPFDDKILKRKEESIDFSLGNKYYNYEALRSKSVQDYRLDNAKIAITAARLLGKDYKIDSEDIIKGLAAYHWPGRMDYITEDIIIDGAHNPDGMKAFAEYINVYEQHRAIDIMFACMPDKDADQMIHNILSINTLSTVYIPLTTFIDRAAAEKLSDQFKSSGHSRIIIVENLKQFIENKISDVGARTLLGCVGSLYLVGEVLNYKRRMRHD